MLVFPVTSYPWKTFAAVLSIITLLPLAIIAAVLAGGQVLPDWLFIFALAVAIGFMLSVSVALTAVLVYEATRNEITSRGGTIHIKGGAFHERLELDSVIAARIVDLGKDKAYAPAKRKNALGLPWFQVGWYTLANGSWTFVLRAGRRRVVYVETNRRFNVMLGVKDPQRLLNHIRNPDADG